MDDKYRLQRYRLMEEDQGCEKYKHDNGEWVKWNDVESLLQAYLSLIDNKTKKEDLSITEITMFT